MTIADIIRASSFRGDAKLPPLAPLRDAEMPDMKPTLSTTLYICNCPSYSKNHRH